MKIGILTFFESTNYGTILQAYALQKYLADCGHEVELVHIYRDIHTVSGHYKTQTSSYSFFEKVMVKLRSVVAEKKEQVRGKKFKDFQKEYLNVSPVFYEDDEQLESNPPQYDLYISGGDQIWNPYHKVFSAHYMWDFLPKDVAIVSYASSFGVEIIEDRRILKEMQKHLLRYQTICVREKSGVRIVESMGLKASQVVDPVFLLRSQWEYFIQPSRGQKKYCLVYALIDYPKCEDKQIAEYAKVHQLDVKIIPYSRRNCLNSYIGEFDAGPIDFLNLIANAEFVFTNSFHGVAFSILFQKQFRLLSAVSDEGNSKRDRLKDLLEQCSIEDSSYGNIIDYTIINRNLEEMIRKSEYYLRTMCKRLI